MRNLVLALPPLAVCLEMRGLGEAAYRALTAPGTALLITGGAYVVSHSSSVSCGGGGGGVISVEWPGPCWLSSLLYPIVGTQEDHATT